MPPTTSAPAARKSRRTPLPPITVAKLEETGLLLERVVQENQQLFVQRGQEYRETHRTGASRPLSALEAAQIAVTLDTDDRLATAAEVQESNLRAYDEPDGREILLATGLAVAPAFVKACREVVALVEMPSSEFEQACEDDQLPAAIETRAAQLRLLELSEAKKRTSAAFEHYANAAGFEPGEAWRLPVQAVWQALQGATQSLAAQLQPSQLIDSAASTDGTGPTSSTGSSGETPSS